MSKDLPITISSKVDTGEYFEFKGKQYNVTWEDSVLTRHGGPFDRGSADSYYGRGPRPHYFMEGTATSPKVEESAMTQDQLDEYYAGYAYNEEFGDKKDW